MVVDVPIYRFFMSEIVIFTSTASGKYCVDVLTHVLSHVPSVSRYLNCNVLTLKPRIPVVVAAPKPDILALRVAVSVFSDLFRVLPFKKYLINVIG